MEKQKVLRDTLNLIRADLSNLDDPRTVPAKSRSGSGQTMAGLFKGEMNGTTLH